MKEQPTAYEERRTASVCFSRKTADKTAINVTDSNFVKLF